MLTYSVIPPGALGTTGPITPARPVPRPGFVPPRAAPVRVPAPAPRYAAPRVPIVQPPRPPMPQPARTALPRTSAPVTPRVTTPGEAPRVPAPTTTRFVVPPSAPGRAIPVAAGIKAGPPAVPVTPRVPTPSVPLPQVPRTTLPANGVPKPVKPFLQLVPPSPTGGARPPAGSAELPPVSPSRATPYDRELPQAPSAAPSDAEGLQRTPGPSMIAVPRFSNVPSAFPAIKAPMSTKKKVAIAGGAAAGVTGLVLLLALL